MVPILEIPLGVTKTILRKSRVSLEVYYLKQLAIGMGVVNQGRKVNNKKHQQVQNQALSRVTDVDINREEIACNRNNRNKEETNVETATEVGTSSINVSDKESENDESRTNITSPSVIMNKKLGLSWIEKI